MQRPSQDMRAASQPLKSIIAGREIGSYSSRMRRFIILFAVLQLVAGSLVGLAHAKQLAAGTADIQVDCQNAPGAGGDQGLKSCDICSHGLVNGVGLELGSKFLALARSNPIPAEQPAAKSWLDHPAGEPPK